MYLHVDQVLLPRKMISISIILETETQTHRERQRMSVCKITDFVLFPSLETNHIANLRSKKDPRSCEPHLFCFREGISGIYLSRSLSPLHYHHHHHHRHLLLLLLLFSCAAGIFSWCSHTSHRASFPVIFLLRTSYVSCRAQVWPCHTLYSTLQTTS